MDDKNKGFTITCNNCGSTNCEVNENHEYNYDYEEYVFQGIEIICKECLQQR